MPKKGEYVKSKKLWIMQIFESILVPQDNGK